MAQSPHCQHCVFLGNAAVFMGAACWKCSESKLYAYKLHAYEATLPFRKVHDTNPQNLLATAARSLDSDLPPLKPDTSDPEPQPGLMFRALRWSCYQVADALSVLF
jgi:hypothetical protein